MFFVQFYGDESKLKFANIFLKETRFGGFKKITFKGKKKFYSINT